MKLIGFFTIGFFSILLSAMPSMAQSNDIEGLWLTQNERAAVKIEKCKDGQSLCGDIAWIIAGGMQTDSQNEDESLRGRPLCGMQILYGFRQGKQANEWLDGKIYKADDGDVYNASVTQVDNNRLRLRGYVGMPLFGKTQMWTRVNPAEYPSCN
tara:strand:- start:146 stop:607 length:462 start_codon:yes stop_codon:yes gene_type:complete